MPEDLFLEKCWMRYTCAPYSEMNKCIPGILPISSAMLENVRSLTTKSNLVPGRLTIIAKTDCAAIQVVTKRVMHMSISIPSC